VSHLGVKTGKARLALSRDTARVGVIVPIRSPVRIHPAVVWREGGRPDRQSMATQGDTERRARKPSSRPSLLRERSRFPHRAAADSSRTGMRKAEQFGIGGMKPDRQPAHRCG